MDELNSLWAKTAPINIPKNGLEEDVTCDILIIGGGFTGCSSALHLAEAGQNVVLLEAHDFGYGGSGRNVGLVNAGLWTPPDDVENTLGQKAGAHLNDLLGNAPRLVFDLIEKHKIECELSRVGTLHLGHTKAGVKDLENRARQWQKRGAAVHMLGRDETHLLTGSRAYDACLLDERAGTINPMGYVRGLANAAIAAGAQIYTDSPAISFSHEQDEWHIKTAKANIIAKKVIMAVNAYGGKLVDALNNSFIPIYFSQFATEPLPDEVRKTILPKGHGTWDTCKIMRSYRLDAEGRLILGTMGKLPKADTSFLSEWARKTLHEIFPQLESFNWESQWDGVIAYTPDNMPRLHMLGDNMIIAMGYNGRGIGPGTVFGKAIANYLTSGDPDHLPIPLTKPVTASFRNVKHHFYEISSQLEHRFGIITKIGM